MRNKVLIKFKRLLHILRTFNVFNFLKLKPKYKLKFQNFLMILMIFLMIFCRLIFNKIEKYLCVSHL